MSGRLKAYVLLAWAFITTLISRWLTLGNRYGLRAFHANYAADRLDAMTQADRHVLLGAGRCTACGRCQQGDGPLLLESRGAYPGLMTLVLSAARDTSDAAQGARGFAWLSVAELERREALCPEQVPIVQLARFVTRHAAEQGGTSTDR
jgi:hypothetical protein